MKNLVDRILQGLPTEPAPEEWDRVEEAIAERASRLAESLDSAGLARVIASVYDAYANEVDRGFREGDLACEVASFELEKAALWRLLRELRQK